MLYMNDFLKFCLFVFWSSLYAFTLKVFEQIKLVGIGKSDNPKLWRDFDYQCFFITGAAYQNRSETKYLAFFSNVFISSFQGSGILQKFPS